SSPSCNIVDSSIEASIGRSLPQLHNVVGRHVSPSSESFLYISSCSANTKSSELYAQAKLSLVPSQIVSLPSELNIPLLSHEPTYSFFLVPLLFRTYSLESLTVAVRKDLLANLKNMLMLMTYVMLMMMTDITVTYNPILLGVTLGSLKTSFSKAFIWVHQRSVSPRCSFGFTKYQMCFYGITRLHVFGSVLAKVEVELEESWRISCGYRISSQTSLINPERDGNQRVCYGCWKKVEILAKCQGMKPRRLEAAKNLLEGQKERKLSSMMDLETPTMKILVAGDGC
uniref:Uncharacterized protein n=1 Tax=Cucumis melo TaxID=3656 RepID=A0A9I9EGQ4_CUCME